MSEDKKHRNGDRILSTEAPGIAVFLDAGLVKQSSVRYLWTCTMTGLDLFACDSDFAVEGLEFIVDDVIATQF
ncbi:MAG: hypothetical protein FWE08_06975 [Oscillospiraceae bacterium]|nr:hypothetical protein [Oscillospiraceae bacterium]